MQNGCCTSSVSAVGLSLGSIVKQSNMNATASALIAPLTSSGIGGA